MGKAIIINGADFSANAISPVLVDMFTEYVGSQTFEASKSSAAWTWSNDVQYKYAGHTITQISLAIYRAGEITISKVNDVLNGTPTEICKILADKIGFISFDVEPFEIKDNEYLVVGSTNDSGNIGYVYPSDIGFYRKVGQSGTDYFPQGHIPIKICGF